MLNVGIGDFETGLGLTTWWTLVGFLARGWFTATADLTALELALLLTANTFTLETLAATTFLADFFRS